VSDVDNHIEIDSRELLDFAASLDPRKVSCELLLLKKRLELSETEKDNRGRVSAQTLAAAQFIRSLFGAALPAPLVKLAVALTELDDGIRSSLFNPVSRGVRGPKGVEHRGLKAQAAIATTLLMKNGHTEDEALRRVGERLRRIHIPLGQTETPPMNVVKNWRKEVMGGDKTDDPATRHYFLTVGELACHKMSDEEILDRLAKGASNLYL
jgi:hypothetical protein